VRIWSTPKVAHATSVETAGSTAWLSRMSPHYAEIKKPLYILAQAGSEFRRAAAQKLQQQVAGSTLTLVPDTGHYIQFEQTGAVVEAIRAVATTTLVAR